MQYPSPDATPRHQIIVCVSCRHWSRAEPAGPALINNLSSALITEGLKQLFEVSGVACMAGCDRPCTVAWCSAGKATWLFGDIDPDADMDDLVAFARLYQRLGDGWCRAADRPGKLARSTLAHIPAALTVTKSRRSAQ
jgi:predicted metal-binding protein